MGVRIVSTPFVCTVSVLLSGTGTVARAQPTPDYNFQWRTIGSPGNTDASPEQFPFLAIDGIGPIGGVNYEYRMTQTEVTVGQYLEFVRAYAPHYRGSINDPALTGVHIYSSTGNPADPQFTAEPGSLNFPTNMSWLNAARFCNWLTNNKGTQSSAFESGAYTMSSFVFDPVTRTWDGQRVHSPGATFWIPSLDEWTKGMHFDPNKHGPGQPGYWLYPTSSDLPPVGGLPGTPGAQTSAGDYPNSPDNPFRFYDVGSYPSVQSPWGLLDGSGGRGEYLEAFDQQLFTTTVRGSGSASLFPSIDDRLDSVGFGPPDGFLGGLRIASSIPSPCTVAVLLAVTFQMPRSRRLVHV